MGRRTGTTLAGVLAFCICGAAAAEGPPVYTLDDCLRIGIERSIPLANAQRDERIARAKIKQVGSQALPSLDLNSSYTRLDEVPSFPGIEEPFGREDNYRVSLDADQLLFSGGQVKAALDAAKYFRNVSEEEIERQHAVLVRDITKSFYAVLFAKASVDVAAESVKQLEDFEEQAKLKYEHETLSEFDWLSARVKLANERPKLVRERNNLELAKTAFRNLVYLEEKDFELDGELSYEPIAPDADTLYGVGLENRPEIAQAESNIELLEANRRVSRGTYFPEIRAVASYTGTNPADEEPAEDEWDWGWNAGVTLSWSLLDGGLRRGEMVERALELAKARAELDDLKRGIELEIQNAYLTLNNAREVVMGSQEGVDLAEKALEIARVRYRKGLSTYLEFTDSNLALSNARLIHYQALLSYQQALANLRYACGTRDLPTVEETSDEP